MLINKMILDNLYQDAGKDKIEEIEKYNKNSKIDIKEFNYENDCNFEVRAIVVDKEKTQRIMFIFGYSLFSIYYLQYFKIFFNSLSMKRRFEALFRHFACCYT